MRKARFTAADCSVQDLEKLLEQSVDTADFPLSDRVEQGVLVYSSDALRAADRLEAEAEIAKALDEGPGIVVLTGAFEADVVDRVSDGFWRIIDEQKASGKTSGDHFAKPGANDRVWNALEKLALLDPGAFVDYYANDMVALASSAWLGPGYQMTSQVNVVNPGGEGQTVHRDYHLGFLGPEVSERFPRHVHLMSPQLTLQGAVAHVDMQSSMTVF